MTVAFLLLVAAVAVILRVETHYEGLLVARRSLLAQWKPAIKAAEVSRRLTESQRLLHESMGTSQDRLTNPSWVRLFKALGLIVPPALILNQMGLRGEDGGWGGDLEGEVVAPDAYAAQVAFNGFYRHLKESMGMEEMKVLPLRVTSFTETGVEPGAGAAGRPPGESPAQRENEAPGVVGTKIEFEVHGRLKGF